jgi:hypothetical protein
MFGRSGDAVMDADISVPWRLGQLNFGKSAVPAIVYVGDQHTSLLLIHRQSHSIG